MTSESEHLVLLARLADELRPVPIYTVDPPAPISCEWLGVAYVWPADSYILYFLDSMGAPQELLQFGTREIAVDQAHAICGHPQSGWTRCNVALDVDAGTYPVDQLQSAMRDGTAG